MSFSKLIEQLDEYKDSIVATQALMDRFKQAGVSIPPQSDGATNARTLSSCFYGSHPSNEAHIPTNTTMVLVVTADTGYICVFGRQSWDLDGTALT